MWVSDIAISRFFERFNDGLLAVHAAGNLTCDESEVLVDLMKALGDDECADLWERCHAGGDDDPDDLHFRGDPKPVEAGA